MTPIERLSHLFESGASVRMIDLRRWLGSAYASLHQQNIFRVAEDEKTWRCRECAEEHEVFREEVGGAWRCVCYCERFGTREIDDASLQRVEIAQAHFAEACFGALLGGDTDIGAKRRISAVLWEAAKGGDLLPRPLYLARRLDDASNWISAIEEINRTPAEKAIVLVNHLPEAAARSRFAASFIPLADALRISDGGLAAISPDVAAQMQSLPKRAPGRPRKGQEVARRIFDARAEAGESIPAHKYEAAAIVQQMRDDGFSEQEVPAQKTLAGKVSKWRKSGRI